MNMNEFQLILAIDENFAIGNHNALPWPKNKKDMQFFMKKTSGHIVIMGRKTWESIPSEYRPLSNRINIIISRTQQVCNTMNDTFWCTSTIDVLKKIEELKKIYKDKEIFVIGGNEIYKQFLDHQIISVIWLTRFNKTYTADVFFDKNNLDYFILSEVIEKTDDMVIEKYTYKNKEEHQYLTHLKKIIETGNYRENRTEVNTYSLFCPPQLRFNLRNNRIPLLTTKKNVLRQIFIELMFYLSGSSDSKKLEKEKVFVWKGNTTREFLDNRGLKHYREGDMGPSYSFNFRHFGAQYIDCDADYNGKGFDQVQYCIDSIKKSPNSRRIIIDLWDSNQLDKMSLPPCMHKYQFYVNHGFLSLHAELRSSDTFLGFPWNIGTASLLCILMAYVCDLKPGDLIMTVNDAHVYENQLNVAKEQLEREPYNFPLLFIKDDAKKDLFNIKYEDLELLNYRCHPKLSVEMVV